jgi:hypothetical protein
MQFIDVWIKKFVCQVQHPKGFGTGRPLVELFSFRKKTDPAKGIFL